METSAQQKLFNKNHDPLPCVGLPGGDEVGLVAAPPLDEEVQLPGGVRGADDALGLEAAVEAAGAVVLLGVEAGRGRGGRLLRAAGAGGA